MPETVGLAHTRVRLKGFITLRTMVDPVTGEGGTFLADPEKIAENFKNARIVGSCQQIDVEQTRTTNGLRREFGTLTGIPKETYPGLPEFKATLHRVDLYDANLLEAFGFDDVNIVGQFKPFVIIINQPVPLDGAKGLVGEPLTIPGGVMKRRTYIMDGCWFGSMPLEFNIMEADQKFVQTVDITFRDITARSF